MGPSIHVRNMQVRCLELVVPGYWASAFCKEVNLRITHVVTLVG